VIKQPDALERASARIRKMAFAASSAPPPLNLWLQILAALEKKVIR
jgi:hypothetical protein